MAVISGILKDPIGGTRVGVVIELRAIRTSATVVNQARSQSITDAAGKYTLTVEPGAYDVMITAGGRQPERVGGITVALNSQSGTLNDFLTMPGVTDLNPEIVATVDRMRADTAESAAAAKVSETNAVAAMANALSKVVTTDQSVASTVLLTKPVRLSSAASVTGFIPNSQGAWVSWNRKTATDDGLTGATDFINHKGTLNGGWHFWSTDGATINLSTRINWDGSIKTMGGIVSYTDQIMQAGNTAPNLLLRFRDKDGVEKGAVYSQTDTGAMNIRWNGQVYTMICRTDGFVTHPRGATMSAVLNYADITTLSESSLGNAPISFRGTDVASFNDTNNYNIGTWNGFAVVPTIGANLSPGVTQGKPVFYVNARTGVTYALNGLYVGSTPVLKIGDYGVGKVNNSTTFDFTKIGPEAGFYKGIESQLGAPTGASLMAGASVSVSSAGSYTGHIYTAHGATPSTIKLYAGWTRPTGTIDFVSALHSGNTTVDANGFVKKASPIVKLFGDGSSELNEESQGVMTGRISEGVYRVSGVLGFNGDGAWGGAGNGIEIPVDDNKRALVWVESKVLPDGDIEIRTYHRTYDTGPYSARNIEAIETDAIDSKGKVIKGQKIYVPIPDGTPIDIPAGRWIDLRVEMPASDESEPVFEAEPQSEALEVVPTPESDDSIEQPVVNEPEQLVDGSVSDEEAEQGEGKE